MKRNVGFDIVRSFAIIFVLVDHAEYFFRKPSMHTNILGVFGVLGVELFFVLSGFLIGKILLEEVVPGISWQTIRRFYIRRWLRTLPVYYALLSLFILIEIIVYKSSNLHLYHFVFLQNFFDREVEFFGVTWSLSIEEWFYLFLPVLFLVFQKKTNPPKTIFILLSIIIFAEIMLRFFVFNLSHPSFESVRKSIPLRFDSLLIGVLLITLKINSSSIYKKLNDWKVFSAGILFLSGLMLYYQYLYIHHVINNSLFFHTLGFTLISFAIACLFPFLENSIFLNKTITQKPYVVKAITTTSVISYSLYLIHLEVFIIFIVMLSKYINSFLLLIMAVATSFILSHIMYSYFEKPILDLRKKITIAQSPTPSV